MFGHLALVDQDGFIGVDARRDKTGTKLARAALEVRRVLPDGDGVQIYHAVDRLYPLVLRIGEAFERAQVVSKVQIARRLDAGKHTRGERGVGHWMLR